MMDRARAELLLTDVLAGEISIEDLDELDRYEVETPEFKEYREGLEVVWGLDSSESFIADTGSDIFLAKISSIVANAVYGDGKVEKLSLDNLDLLSAAGSDMLGVDHDIDK